MGKTSNFYYTIVVTMLSFLLVSFIVGGLYGFFELKDERSYTDFSYETYNDGWHRVYSDGTTEPLVIPGDYKVEEGQSMIIERTLSIPQDKDVFLAFDSAKQNIVAYVDDELRYSYDTDDTRAFGSFSPDIITYIPLHPADNGKCLRIELTGDNNYTGVLASIGIGTQMGIAATIFNNEYVEVMLALALIFLGVIAAIMGFCMRHIYHMEASIGFLGWGITLAGIWVICESQFREFMIPNFSFASMWTFVCIMLMPPCFALYFDNLQKGRYRPIYLIICVFSILENVLSVILQFSGGIDFSNSINYSFMLFGADVLVYFITVIPDFINKKVKEYILEFIGIVGGIVASILQMVVYFTHPANMDGRIMCLGLLFLLIMACIRAFMDILNLERDKAAAEQASQASSDFLARMSHEMRTPINAVLGMNKMILKESTEEAILDYARDVNNAGNNLLGIVNEVLDLAKVTSGNIDITPCEYDIIDMVRECYSLVNPRAKASRLAFVVEMDDILPARLYGDRERIVQIIVNLLTNAVKYTNTGRVTFSIQGKVNDGSLMLVITVSDTGIGIKEENLPYIFDSYKRVGDIAESKIEGTGLGLAITKQLVDLMGGKISVESTYGKGSTFNVIIPQGIRSIEPCGQFSMGPNGDRRVMERNQIYNLSGDVLIVDDVAINLRVFSMLLKDTALKVDMAKSGQETIEKIRHKKYDIIFLDHLMPGMSGVETKQIMDGMDSNKNKDTPVIMQTANAIVGAKDKYLHLGFADYIAKPLKEEELFAILKKYLS